MMKFSTEWEKTCSKPPTRLGFSWNTINFMTWSWDKYGHSFGTAARFLPFTVTSHYIPILPLYTSWLTHHFFWLNTSIWGIKKKAIWWPDQPPLVGGLNPSEKYLSVGGYYSQYMEIYMEKIKNVPNHQPPWYPYHEIAIWPIKKTWPGRPWITGPSNSRGHPVMPSGDLGRRDFSSHVMVDVIGLTRPGKRLHNYQKSPCY